MRSESKRVIIGVPVYNGAAMLGEMLESLRAQTFSAFQVTICDNASTDGTAEIARRFVAADPRFVYHRNETNIGAAPNYNRVFELGHDAPYFKWAPHDDLYAPAWLERCVEALDGDPAAVLAWSMVDVVDETGEGRALDHASYHRGVQASFVDEHGRRGWTMGPLHLAEGPDPAVRLGELLDSMIGCFAGLGLIRTDALRRSSLQRSYYGADRALLAELVLMGPFRQVPERLYTNRYHKTASRDLTASQRRSWIDARGAVGWPTMRQRLDILRAPAVAGLSPRDRARCIAVALRHFARRQVGAAIRGILHRGGPAGASGRAAA